MAIFKKENELNEPDLNQVGANPTQTRIQSVLGDTLLIKGELSSDDDVLIEGKVEGHVNVKKKVTVGKNGRINAEIRATDISILGQVEGNIFAKNKAEILASGRLSGNIHAKKVVLAEGAIFQGNVAMDDLSAPTIPKQAKVISKSQHGIPAKS